MKNCNLCKKYKSYDQFYKQRNGYQYICKACKKIKDREYYLDNKEKIYKKAREYVKNHKEKNLEYKTKWRKNNAEQKRIADALYRKNNREKRKQYNLDWYKKHPGRKQELLLIYRAKKKQNYIEDVDIAKVYERDLGLCQVCGFPVESDFHLDHKIPISKHGVHSYANCQTAHASCNFQKSNKMPSEIQHLWRR